MGSAKYRFNCIYNKNWLCSLYVISFHYCVIIQKKEDMLGLIWPHPSHIEVIRKKVNSEVVCVTKKLILDFACHPCSCNLTLSVLEEPTLFLSLLLTISYGF